MPGYRITRRAKLDMAEIWEYIARDSEHHATEFILSANGSFFDAGRQPESWP